MWKNAYFDQKRVNMTGREENIFKKCWGVVKKYQKEWKKEEKFSQLYTHTKFTRLPELQVWLP